VKTYRALKRFECGSINWVTIRAKWGKRNQKKTPLTNAIFEQLASVNEEAQGDASILRLSLDAKAGVKVGPFSRKGKNRVKTVACDHDFAPETTVTPYGIFLPGSDELFLYCTTSKVTSDFMVDVLEAWWLEHRSRFPLVQTLLLNQDNGPENQSRRTQFMKRMVDFAQRHKVNLRLAYYPPYHSKYNPIERTWGILENHWNGNIAGFRIMDYDKPPSRLAV
jgi:hypothetical protein